jgi:hypothetical protein
MTLCIILIALAVVVVIALIVLAVLCMRKKRNAATHENVILVKNDTARFEQVQDKSHDNEAKENVTVTPVGINCVNRVYSGMAVEEYMAVCKEIFNKNDKNNDGALVIGEFKEFTIACAKAAGATDGEVESMKGEESDTMWSMMFRQFDANKDGDVTWDEAWNFLRENKP